MRTTRPMPESKRLRMLAEALTDARRACRARAGSIYLRDADGLRLVIAQNDDLAPAVCDATALFLRVLLTWSDRGIATYVALTGATVRLADVYCIPPHRPYSFDPRFDAQTGFRTVSMLALPLRTWAGGVYGVLQLINAADEQGAIVPFEPGAERVVETFAAQLGAVA